MKSSIGIITDRNDLSENSTAKEYFLEVELPDGSKAHSLTGGDEIDLRDKMEFEPLSFDVLDRGHKGRRVKITYAELDDGRKIVTSMKLLD